MTEQEADQIIGGILRRWFTAEQPEYFCWSENDLTLDGGLPITPEEFAALSTIGSGRGYWDYAHRTLSS